MADLVTEIVDEDRCPRCLILTEQMWEDDYGSHVPDCSGTRGDHLAQAVADLIEERAAAAARRTPAARHARIQSYLDGEGLDAEVEIAEGNTVLFVMGGTLSNEQRDRVWGIWRDD